jgi:phage terminase small subunit
MNKGFKDREALRAKSSSHDTVMATAAATDENKPLTEKQLIFVRAWASGESIKTASARAEYNDGATFAYRMTKMPNVLKAFHEEKAKYEEAGKMTRKRVMDGLIEAVEMAKMVSEPASMVSGWREIGKMCGYYEPTKHTVEVKVSGDVTLRQLNGMTDEQLLRLIAQGANPLLSNQGVEDEQEPD